MLICVTIIVCTAILSLLLVKVYDLKKREEALADAHKKHMREVEAVTRQLNEKAKTLETMVQRLSFDNAELTRLNDMKSKFMSMVAHDLKQPLTSIQGYTSVLAEETAEGVSKKILDNVAKSASNMTYLVNDLVDASMLSTGHFKMIMKKFNYNELIEDIYNQYRVIAVNKNITFRFFELPLPIEVEADKLRITQVISNLLNNAFKFTPSGGLIEIRYFTEGDFLRTFIRDNGTGIVNIDRVKVFEKFEQSEFMEEEYKNMGWGLGLSISYDIIQAHHGMIETDSAGPGRGSLFWFSIPLAQPVEAVCDI
jgi:signal transduction histidine kinase